MVGFAIGRSWFCTSPASHHKPSFPSLDDPLKMSTPLFFFVGKYSQFERVFTLSRLSGPPWFPSPGILYFPPACPRSRDWVAFGCPPPLLIAFRRHQVPPVVSHYFSSTSLSSSTLLALPQNRERPPGARQLSLRPK